MAEKKHLVWNRATEYHEGKEYGCIHRCKWNRGRGKGWGTPCHYAMNGFDVTAERKEELYNKDHRKLAAEAGYAVEPREPGGTFRAAGGQIRSEIRAAARERRKGKDFIRRFEKDFYSSIHWLRLHEKGWHYDHSLEPGQVPKRWVAHGVQKTFAVRKGEGVGGYGALYPYHHNYHHMVPFGAVREYVVGNDSLSTRREDIILASKWNIHKKENIILLPKEEFVSRIVGLPAHLPWGTRNHPEYSLSMQTELEQARKNLDNNIRQKKCEKAASTVAFDLDKAVTAAFDAIKSMPAGKQLGAVRRG